ncbi:hypothetical protein ATANTOWER_010726 [Ataeniobius toweri]|uniref:Uncharacterized protein n=1 Tax=Ataeniobius toweri TaxID=208326 RepID=A0ABU7CFC1_9TELE|nr:hypothetical protein [Ataeniobius toweri]
MASGESKSKASRSVGGYQTDNQQKRFSPVKKKDNNSKMLCNLLFDPPHFLVGEDDEAELDSRMTCSCPFSIWVAALLQKQKERRVYGYCVDLCFALALSVQGLLLFMKRSSLSGTESLLSY